MKENLVSFDKADESYGGKAFGLALLEKNGFKVPRGYAISPDYVEDISAKINVNLDKLQEALQTFPKDAKLAVRSSAIGEDGTNRSFAGIFESRLNVDCGLEEVLKAIKSVHSSASSFVMKSYDSKLDIKMGVVLQQMVDPLFAGVAFTNCMDIDGSEVCLVEFVEGLADKLVGGTVIPYRIVAPLRGKKISLGHLRYEGGCADISRLDGLLKELEAVIYKFESPMDIEWCLDKNGETYLIQARPITKVVFLNKKSSTEAVAASIGQAKGKTFTIGNDLEEGELTQKLKDFPEGAILVAEYTDTQYLPAIEKASGILTEEGSILSHAAIISREKGIPCIVGYNNACKLFPTGTEITLDATNGKVISSDTTVEAKGRVKDIDWGSAYCFDSINGVLINGKKVLFETTLDGLAVHLPGNMSSEDLEKVETLARKFYHTSPTRYQDDKYLWYFEKGRFENFPFFNEIIKISKTIAKELDQAGMVDFYEKLTLQAKALVDKRVNISNASERFLIDEVMVSIYFVLNMLLPEGDGLKSVYLSSIPLLYEKGKSFTDFLSGHVNLGDNDDALKKSQEFLKVMVERRNIICGNFVEMGAMRYDYFDDREKRAKEALKGMNISCNEDDNPIEIFYTNIHTLDDKIKSFLTDVMKKKTYPFSQ